MDVVAGGVAAFGELSEEDGQGAIAGGVSYENDAVAVLSGLGAEIDGVTGVGVFRLVEWHGDVIGAGSFEVEDARRHSWPFELDSR